MVQQNIVRVVNPNDLEVIRKSKNYLSRIVIRDGLVLHSKNTDELIHALFPTLPTSFTVITDSTVNKTYGLKILGIFSKIAKTNLIVVSPGEKSKTFRSCLKIIRELSRLNVDRDAVVVLLGGGVVGDLGGFAASIYKRGIRQVHVPTTLLAQIDSSIGGKNGVNTADGKNQVGTVRQPDAVLVDPKFLETLPSSQILNGIGETIKYGVIASSAIFKSLEENCPFRVQDLSRLVEPCCRIKARVVSKDEFDLNFRSILNYGHTIGHAVEASSHYKLGHGLAVMIGMLCEGWIARELGIFESSDFTRQNALIKKILPKSTAPRLSAMASKSIRRYALGDKKNTEGKLMMSLPQKIGKMHSTATGSYRIEIPLQMVEPSVAYAKTALNTEK
jgi:3-dehydroquinate synthase